MERLFLFNYGVPTPETVDYDRIYAYDTSVINPSILFEKYLMNRGGREDALSKHVKEIRDAIIKEGGMDKFPPITVDINTLLIADGNCRFQALLDIVDDNLLDKPIKYRVIYEDIPKDEFDERVIELNQGQKSWTLLDFVYNYSLRGFDSYSKFINFCENDETLHTADGKINPRYASAVLGKNVNDLKKPTLTLTDKELEIGKVVAKEAKEVRLKFSKDLKANGGGWYEAYLRAWSEFRELLPKDRFKDYLREVSISVQNRKREVKVPFGSNKKADWNAFFRTVKTYME